MPPFSVGDGDHFKTPLPIDHIGLSAIKNGDGETFKT